MLGDAQSDLIAAAVTLWQFFQGTPPDGQPHAEVQAFQQAWLNAGYSLHGVGGVYDAPTAAAFQVVLDTDPLGQGVPEAAPAPSPAAPVPDLAASATAMNAALGTRGYKKADKPLYGAFQAAAQAAGLYHGAIDDFPGVNTMGALKYELGTLGQALTTVHIYPWLSCPQGESTSAGCYDGVNAPPLSEWLGTAAPATSPKPAPQPAPQAPAEASMLGVLAAVAALGALVVGGAAVYEKKTGKKLFHMAPMMA